VQVLLTWYGSRGNWATLLLRPGFDSILHMFELDDKCIEIVYCLWQSWDVLVIQQVGKQQHVLKGRLGFMVAPCTRISEIGGVSW